MLRYMLDTNICIYAIKKRPPGLRERFNSLADQLCISAIILAEIICGAEKSSRPVENLGVVEHSQRAWTYCLLPNARRRIMASFAPNSSVWASRSVLMI